MLTRIRFSNWIFLGGVLAGFLLATWQGWLASTYLKPSNFQRFHQRLSPDAIFYPPYSMMENLALARWKPGQVLVIIGGNSILNGVGQPEKELWSRRLQGLLGDRYVVVNLALRGAPPAVGAALVAEYLQARGLPVIYVSNSSPVSGPGRAPEGTYGYFYWQAVAGNLLPPYTPREDDIREWLSSLPAGDRTTQQEWRISGWLEAHFHAQSLWTHIGYRYVFTVWTALLSTTPWVARDTLADNEHPARPLNERFHDTLEQEMPSVRILTSSTAQKDAQGHWQLTPTARTKIRTDIEARFSPVFRQHMLMLLNEPGAFYRRYLTDDERARNTYVYAATAEVWQQNGIQCLVVGEDFEPIDNIDHAHLSSDGGYKMAALVAKGIQASSIFPRPR